MSNLFAGNLYLKYCHKMTPVNVQLSINVLAVPFSGVHIVYY